MIRSIVTKGVASSTASFLSNQTGVDLKQERLNELLIEINSAIEYAKAHEPILNSSLCKWLDDLKKASQEGTEVQIAFRDQSEDTRSIIPWKAAVRLYKRSRRVNRLNVVVTRLERKASNCEKFRQMLRDETSKQQNQTYTKRVEKLERKVARLRNSLKTIRSNGPFMKRKKSKHADRLRRGHHNAITISEPKFGDHNHDEPEEKEDPSSEQEIQQLRPNKRLTTVPKFDEWGDMNSSPSTVGFDEIFNRCSAEMADVESTPVQMVDKPLRSPGRDAYSGINSLLSRPTKRLGLPEIGECGDINSSSVGGGGVYTMYFEKARMKKDAVKATPIQVPAKSEHTPERSAHRSDISFLSRLFACISLNTRN